MYVLGLSFGHDAGVCLIKDGVVANNLIKERHNGAKHAAAMSVELIEKALLDAGITIKDVDFVGLTSTQLHALLHNRKDDFSIEIARMPGDDTPSLIEMVIADGKAVDSAPAESTVINKIEKLSSTDANEPSLRYLKGYFPEYDTEDLNQFSSSTFYDSYFNIPFLWDAPCGLEELAERDFSPVIGKNILRYGMHYPINLSFKGHQIPGIMVQHHAAHAAACHYMASSHDDSTIVFSHDGGSFLPSSLQRNGMYFYGDKDGLYPLANHWVTIGALYDLAGLKIGFDLWGAGKLMGLAPYGRPKFFDRKYVGNHFNWVAKGIENGCVDWSQHCLDMAAALGYDMTALGDPRRMTEPINADIAASTQLLFEETVVAAVETVEKIALRHRLPLQRLCISGGPGLNCVTNTRIANQSAFDSVFVSPHCDDSGLSMGAAKWAYYNVLGNPFNGLSAEVHVAPFWGEAIADEAIEAAIQRYSKNLEVQELDDISQSAANELADDKVLAIFKGRSEVGPRALGHRSLIVDPRHQKNWERLNKIKRREIWRPFAPAILKEYLSDYFHVPKGLTETPFMLNTFQVRSNEIPAVTHVNGTARVQTVDEGHQPFRGILEEFYKLTGVPICMNTSFNGPGQPIIERPEDAIEFFLTAEVDVLYLENFRITKSKE